MGESITEATVGEILIPSGSTVNVDDEILELETDKVNQVLYAPESGVLKLNVNTDDVVKIDQVIGHVEPGKGKPKEEKEPEKAEEEKSESKAEEKKPEPKREEPKAEKPQEKKKEPASKVEGSARETKSDFIAGLKEGKESKPAAKPEKESAPKPKTYPKGERIETRKRMSKVRRVIAKRLVEAQQSTAMLTTFNEVDLSKVMELRSRYKDSFQKEHGVKLGFMSFFVKAAVSALRENPELNSYIDGDEIVHREYFDIGIAVGTERGLFVPVIRDCDQLNFAEIEAEIVRYAEKAKNGKLSIEELQGGGFTITNGGIYGSLLSTPILNPPQSGILGMHKIQKRPVVVDDEIVIRPMMYLAMSYDHRIIDGKEAVAFLVHIKDCLEDPARLMLEV